jgi:hypothetical protein
VRQSRWHGHNARNHARRDERMDIYRPSPGNTASLPGLFIGPLVMSCPSGACPIGDPPVPEVPALLVEEAIEHHLVHLVCAVDQPRLASIAIDPFQYGAQGIPRAITPWSGTCCGWQDRHSLCRAWASSLPSRGALPACQPATIAAAICPIFRCSVTTRSAAFSTRGVALSQSVGQVVGEFLAEKCSIDDVPLKVMRSVTPLVSEGDAACAVAPVSVNAASPDVSRMIKIPY